MYFSKCLAAAISVASYVAAAPTAAAPKLLICSDSTTANYATTDALQGWGFYAKDYLSMNVTNLAKNGRSTRSFINEGLWASLLKQTASGDFVVIEMGHNDDGDPTTSDRATLPGTGEDTKAVTTTTGSKETVHSFGWYLRKMIADVKGKGATPIISGMVNRNYWSSGKLQTNWPFATYAQQVASAAGVEYIDHTKYSVALFQSLGQTKATSYFPNDKTHTNAAGAKLNTQTFIQAVKYKCSGTSKLKSFLNTAANAITTPAKQAC
ncbi:hypothetical protein B9Z65_9151 [Elsinoe australis]|uniref:SGNH hydrolase-type esterase domain-containing protein n=1 Tax=Elsinoe australis TaxID=40998 RepID=A0A2P7Z0M0_9PEZI|nr:hypothetical protein B9Z65_9151 [Elsinoe australis]